MSNSNHLIRWTVAGRWIATVGIGLVVALGYALFRPAHAQDGRSPTKRRRSKNCEAPPPRPTAAVC